MPSTERRSRPWFDSLLEHPRNMQHRHSRLRSEASLALKDLSRREIRPSNTAYRSAPSIRMRGVPCE